MDKHEDWLRSLRNRMTELGWKLALCLSDPECEPEKLAHAKRRYDEQLRQCEKEMPEWADWFMHGGELTVESTEPEPFELQP